MKFKRRRTEDFSEWYKQPETPFYHLVPKDLQGNLEFRQRMIGLGKQGKRNQEELWGMCQKDILFYINTFCYTLSPKDYPDSPDRPFITYPFQDELILGSLRVMGKQDIVVPKSRDMGITWVFMAILEWMWHFRPRQQLMMISRKEPLVDTKGDPGSLLGKIDYLHEFMPQWLLPTNRHLKEDDPNRRHMFLKNADNGSLITGESTVPDLGRAKRFQAIFMDEHASLPKAAEISRATQSATDTRIAISTPKGTGGHGEEFFRWTTPSPVRYIRQVHWREHPEKSVGLYEYDLEEERLRIWDPNYPFPEDYHFIKDGKIRSPWYDFQCERAVSEKDIEQELDINFLGSGSAFFRPDKIERLKLKCRPAVYIGDIHCDESMMKVEFIENESGYFRIWDKPNPMHRYAVGADVATGSGGDESSNSTLSILDITTHEKVASFACSVIGPREFSVLAVGACKFYGDAVLVWEVNGPGGAFGRKIINELYYPHIYYRRNLDSIISRESKLPGFFSNKGTKRILFTEFADALYTEKYLNPCLDSLQECLQYTVEIDGSINHERSRTRINEQAAGPNHGDRVVADALSWLVSRDITDGMEATDISDLESDPPVGSFAWRRRNFRKQTRLSKSMWD